MHYKYKSRRSADQSTPPPSSILPPTSTVAQTGGSTTTKNRTNQRDCSTFPFEPFERQTNDDPYGDIVIENQDLQDNCTVPTIHNPFMNPLYGSTQEGACNVNNDAIDKEIKEKYYHDQTIDPTMPEYMKRNQLGIHAFYTIPSTSHPSKQEEFAQYLYGNMDNCKTNNCDCKPN